MTVEQEPAPPTRWHRLRDHFGLERNILVMLGIILLVGLGEELWVRFLPQYLVILGAGTWGIAFIIGQPLEDHQMSVSRLLLFVIPLLTIQPHAMATDLKKIDWSIGKEPAYESKPKYCLVVLGPEAKTRVWLVADGGTLYASVNNDELTQFTGAAGNGRWRVPGLQDWTVQVIRRNDKPVGVMFQCQLQLELANRQTTEGMALFGDGPKSAPVVHLDGSYTSTLRERSVIQKGQWVRDAGENASLNVYIGSNVLQDEGKAFLRTWWRVGMPDKIRPVADIEFPHQDPKAEPLKMRVPLIYR
jgi:hypothetical protein